MVTYDGARTMDLPTPEFVVVDEAHMIKNLPPPRRSVPRAHRRRLPRPPQ
ncbi:hypothetical protein QP028_14985 [Corynebacterium suedekumii]|nr:hypothetical protein QP028_14985 [Corynebacterium suedekumii]